MIEIKGRPEELAKYIAEINRNHGNATLSVKQQLADETEAHAETAKELAKEIERQRVSINALKAENAVFEAERDRYKNSAEDREVEIKNLMRHQENAGIEAAALRAENAALKRDAGYWRALVGRSPASTYPYRICFTFDGTVSFRNSDDNPINGFTTYEAAVTAATGYRPEEA